jgi:hypothetical protein
MLFDRFFYEETGKQHQILSGMIIAGFKNTLAELSHFF